jgi:hypothetical protein
MLRLPLGLPVVVAQSYGLGWPTPPRGSRAFGRAPQPLSRGDQPRDRPEADRRELAGTLVSHPDGEIVAAHYPVLLDEASDGLAS